MRSAECGMRNAKCEVRNVAAGHQRLRKIGNGKWQVAN